MNRRKSLVTTWLSMVKVVMVCGLTLSALGVYHPARAASLVVNTLTDSTSFNGLCSLREAIATAFSAAINADCGPNSPVDDTITFSVSGTIFLAGPLSITNTSQGYLTIDGGGKITLSGDTDNDGSGNVQVMIVASGGQLMLKNLTIDRGFINSDGGGLYNLGTLFLEDVTFSNNQANNDGAGLYNGGSLDVTRGIFILNNANHFGGGLFNSGSVTLRDSRFWSNYAPVHGGGIYQASGTTILHRSTIDYNTATQGGGIFNALGYVAMQHSQVKNNLAYGDGGGIASVDQLLVDSSAIYNNWAHFLGGGIKNTGTLNLVNATISGNSVDTDGGGLYNSGTAQAYNATITNNLAEADMSGSGAGGGVVNAGSFVFRNTIIAGNYTKIKLMPMGIWIDIVDECAGSLNSFAYNLMQNYDTSYCSLTGSLPILSDPALSPLGNNGGPTPSHALLANSPAIDNGNPLGCDFSNGSLATDQRGFPRPVDGKNLNIPRCDIGAVEYGVQTIRLPYVVR